VVVELFMADWIPRKVLATPDLLGRLPAEGGRRRPRG